MELCLTTADDTALTEFRRRRLGLVFQFFNLLPTMNVLENVSLPLLLQGVPIAECHSAGRRAIGSCGLRSGRTHFVHQLSGGEQQRTAIARALVHRPSLLIADEPTGNLDTASARRVLELLRRIAAEKLTTLIVVTHSEEVAAAAARRIEMRDGRMSCEFEWGGNRLQIKARMYSTPIRLDPVEKPLYLTSHPTPERKRLWN